MFDELHKLRRWKSFLKGFFDLHSGVGPILVTGSSRLDVYRRGGDSLMGRYFLYHMHPLGVGELARPTAREVDVPADLASALKKAKVLAAFEAKSFTQRKEWVRGVEEAKAAETRARRIAKVVEALVG